MNYNSITFRLIAFIICAFAVTTLCVLFLARPQLRQVVDVNQELLYQQKLDTITGILNAAHQRLELTRMVDAYIDGFQQAEVGILRATYYSNEGQRVYPSIYTSDGFVVMHPQLPAGQSVKEIYAFKAMYDSPEGMVHYTFEGEEKWGIYRTFEPWDWVVLYTVPLDVKYAAVNSFNRWLILIMVGITALAAALLTLVVSRYTIPIGRLAKVATRIAGGDLDAEINVGGRHEVAALAGDFDGMRNAIRNQIEELTSTNEELEAQYEELSATNDELLVTQNDLRATRNYITNIIDSMPSMLVGVDAEGLVTQWNIKASRRTGIPPREAVGRPLDELLPRLAPRMECIRETIATGSATTDPRRARREGAETVYEDVVIYPLSANGVSGAVVRIDDVTEQVRLQEMMVQSEKMLSVGGLAAGMAHEINNPLAGMVQTADVMQNRLTQLDMPANLEAARKVGVPMEKVRQYMEERQILEMVARIRESGGRAAEIVANMLQFARKSDSTRTAHDIAQLLDQCVDLAGSDYDLKKKYDFRRITIIREYEPGLPKVPCEPSKIQQVLINILRNGAEAMQAGANGDGVEKEHRLTLRLANEPADGMVRIEIEDNGPGMDESVRRRVFEPFFTTKPTDEGTGLGLSVSYFIVTDNHGGELSVEAAPETGSRFIIRLPAGENGDG